MARDLERRVFDLLPPELQQGVRRHLAYGDSLFQLLREKLEVQVTHTGATQSAAPIGGRARKGTVTSSKFFKEPLLRVLGRQPGYRMRAKDAIQAVIQDVRDHLKTIDFERTSTGAVRAENKIAFAREFLKREGFIEEPGEDTRGLWILTTAGIKAAKKLRK